MAGLISHLVQRVLSPALGVRPDTHNPFDAPELAPSLEPTFAESDAPAPREPARTGREFAEAPSAPEPETLGTLPLMAAMRLGVPSHAPDPLAPEPRQRQMIEATHVARAVSAALHTAASFEAAPLAGTRRTPAAAERERMIAAPRPRRRSRVGRVDAVEAAIRAQAPVPAARAALEARRTHTDHPEPQASEAASGDVRLVPVRRVARAQASRALLERAQRPQLAAAELEPRSAARPARARASLDGPLLPPATLAARTDLGRERLLETNAQPTVEISIGRVDIRAHTAPQRAPRAAAATPKLDLARYLEQRSCAKR
jgi:hypothetical protein